MFNYKAFKVIYYKAVDINVI